MVRVRAETVVATHTNTDFDAFASLLAARRLYPGAGGAGAAAPAPQPRQVPRPPGVALGTPEHSGPLTWPAATQRVAGALAWCLRDGARQDIVSPFLHTPLAGHE